ncbi:MAG: NAD(P)H-hydrate dehydratase [Thermoanaerobacteraceae bacterium]|nr:NAD(P)H-hydrate dehydratase [Thermoanaerobacteraceae bacterium]
MKVVSPSTMRHMDKIAIEKYEIPGVILMENAGIKVAWAVQNMWNARKNSASRKIALFCGKGNNGGDGFVAARHLANMGFETIVFIIADPNSITGDASINLEITKNMDIQIRVIEELSDLDEVKDMAKGAFVLVDAIFGTGLKGYVRGVAKSVIEIINQLEIPVISVDIPSGICGSTGKILGTAVKAYQTVTLALPKTGLLLYPGAEYVGTLITADIGMPAKLVESINAEAQLLDPKWVSQCFKPFPSDSHKGTFGRVFIIAGSVGMTGAAALSATAAVRSGAGLVTIGIPESLNDILEVKVTEAMTLPLPETSGRSIGQIALGKALNFASKCDAVVLGPGISANDDTTEFVRRFIKECRVPMVIDADGLNAMTEYTAIFKEAKAPIIITPHPGEMARLLSRSVSEVQADRIAAVKTAAEKFGCTAVLKGARTLIATWEGKLMINPTGNAGMATGGSGDVLSGMIGAFLARGMKPHEAAAAGVYLHGLAGDLSAKQQGQICLAATDIIDFLPIAINKMKVYRDDNRSCGYSTYLG